MVGALDLVRGTRPVRGTSTNRPSPGAEFMRGGRGPLFTGWTPALREPADEVRSSWTAAAARATDTIHNSGFISGAIDQAVANTVGNGLRLSATPDSEGLGITTSEAAELGRTIERRFELWARKPLECDVEGRRTFAQMQAAQFRAWFPTGETVAEFPWRRRPGCFYGTKIRLVPAHRLSQSTDASARVVQGIRMDADGLPIGYRFRRRDPVYGLLYTGEEIDLAARDDTGRTRVSHVFDGVPGQVRGISPLVSALRVAKQFDQLSDATLVAAIIQSVFAATIKSAEPTEKVLEGLLTPQELVRLKSEGGTPFDAWLDAQAGWYDRTSIDVGIKGRFAHLFPGDTLDFHAPKHPGIDYRNLALFLMREVMRCIGLTFESGTGDYTGATYSSVRSATGEIFAITLYRRQNIVGPFCQAAYECWLEEDIESGQIAFPGGIDRFLDRRTAACRAEWKGTAKPQADDLKSAKAHEIWKRLGVMSDEMICADLGVDVEDVYEARQREVQMRRRFKLADPPPADVTADDDEEEEPA